MKRAGKIILPLVLILLVTIPVFVFGAGGGERGAPNYPTRPVELLIPMGAGGAHDLTARAVVAVVHRYLGQPMTVTLRPGATGVIGTTEIANAAPDGYRLLFGGPGPNVALPIAQEVPYSLDSFVSIAMVNYTPTVLAVRGDSPYHTVQDLIDAINARPGQMNYATAGVYGNTHLAMAMIWNAYNVMGRIQPVHFDGGGPQLAALLGGQVVAAAPFPSAIIDHVKSGTLRPLAVTDYQRIPADEADGVFANVPTFTELGYPDVIFRQWKTVMAPAGLPREVEMHLRNTFQQLSRDSEFAELLARIGERADQWMDGPDFTRQLAEESTAFERIIRIIQQMEG